MNDVLDHLNKIKERQLKFHKSRIDTVMNSKVPQHILATKEVAKELIADEEKEGFIQTEIGFCFKERLVNKLMYLAYLHGKESAASESRREGYLHAIEVMRNKLDEV